MQVDFSTSSTLNDIQNKLKIARISSHPNDFVLEIIGLSEVSANVLANNLPSWIQSVRFGPIGPKLTRFDVNTFVQNLPAHKSFLIAQQDYLIGVKRTIASGLPDAKKSRQSFAPAVSFSMTQITTDLWFYMSSFMDVATLESFACVDKCRRRLVYIKLLQLESEDGFAKQRHLLGSFIKNAFAFFDIPDIKTLLIKYRNREDIPAINRILVTCCLAILAVITNNDSEFQVKLKELFVLSAIDFTLLKILSCYIHLYKGEHVQCRQLITDEIKTELYNSRYNYLKPHESFSAMLSLNLTAVRERVREIESSISTTLKRGWSIENILAFVSPRDDFFLSLNFYPELERQFIQFCIQQINLLQPDNESGSKNALLLFPLLRFITKNTADDFANLCFKLNYFSQEVVKNSFMSDEDIVDAVKVFSKKDQERILGMLLNALQEMLKDEKLDFFYGGCYVLSGGNFQHSDSLTLRIGNYLKLIRALSPDKLLKFLQQQLNCYILSLTPASELRRLRFVIFCNTICDIKGVNTLTEEWWEIYLRLATFGANRNDVTELKVVIANYIGQNFIAYRSDPRIIWSLIAEEIFYGLHATCVQGKKLTKKAFFDSSANNSIFILSKICRHVFLTDREEVKSFIFNCMFSIVDSQDDAELLIMLLRCCFITQEEFTKFLNDKILADREGKKFILALLCSKEVVEKSRAVKAVVALAPYIKIEYVEKYFDEINQQIQKLRSVDEKESVEEDKNEWFDFLEALTNLVLYISPKKRLDFFASLSEEQLREMYDAENNFSLTTHACQLLGENEALLDVKRIDWSNILASVCDPFVDSYTDLQLKNFKKLVLAAYKKSKDYDALILLNHYITEELRYGNKNYFGSIVSQLFQIAELRDPQEKNELLTECLNAVDEVLETEKGMSVYNDDLETPVSSLAYMTKVRLLCLTNNAVGLKLILKQDKDLCDNEQFKAQVKEELQSLQRDGFTWNEQVQAIIAEFTGAVIPEARCDMRIG